MGLPYTEARHLIKVEAQRQRVSQAQPCSTYNACDRIVAETITSLISTPEYDTSAMDGFALSSAATEIATPETPVTFEVIGTTTAGDRPHSTADDLRDGISPCVEIMTGAPFPLDDESEGFDCCVPIEEVVVSENKISNCRYISVSKPAKRRQHRRFAGGDFTKGDVIVEAGECIQPHHLMALASVGVREVPVLRRPRVAVFSTGSELLESGGKSHQFMIPDANGPYLTSMLRKWGVDVDFRGVIADSQGTMEHAVQSALGDGYDLIVTSGAVSAGRCDIIPGLIKRMGGRTVFHKVAVKPGHPVLFSMLPGEMGETAFFGLPGNPVAAAACLRFFVLPYIQTLQLQRPEEPQIVTLRTSQRTESCNGTKGDVLTFRKEPDIFRPAISRFSHVWIIEDHSPGKTKPFLQADCWVHIPSGVSELGAGSLVSIYPF
ncbi:hypothetical protein BDW74DRAFT_188260 [Aspergillus multicolor]|uniref:molybdopterin molybdotransferase MoeA n=1 Tax=Aspergillus multicolor TaxID=41759 RepID=UPI003CCE276B